MGDCCSQDKHSKLVRPTWDNFGKYEVGIKAASDETIRQFVYAVAPLLATYKIAFIDKHHIDLHRTSAKFVSQELVNVQLLSQGHSMQFEESLFPNEYHRRALLGQQDLVLVNANHFPCKYSITLMEEKNLIFIDNSIFQVGEKDRFVSFVKGEMEANMPKLNGLVLAGGKSTRMGKDKGLLDYHGKPQREHVKDILSKFCEEVYFSARSEQAIASKNVIEDRFLNMGPMGGILSAMMHQPEQAWLIVACDLPLVDIQTLQFLVTHRNPSKIATAFLDPEGQFPEPLITIWEPKSYPLLLHFLGLGYSCPRKVLINSDIELIKAPNIHALANANEPKDYEKIRSELTN